MEAKQAIDALAALAHQHRLAIFRLLIKKGPNGLCAGDISENLSVSPSALSFHLAQMERAGLLRSTRVQRNIIYAVEVEGVRRLLTYLTEDCCGGRAELCSTDRLIGEFCDE